MLPEKPFASLPCSGCRNHLSTHSATGQPVDLCQAFPGKRIQKSDLPYAQVTTGSVGGIVFNTRQASRNMSSLVSVELNGERTKLPHCKDIAPACPFRKNPPPAKKKRFLFGLFS